MEDTGLTDKQRLFCIYYVRFFNATKAYKKAFGCSYETAMANGSRMLRNAKVKKEILSLKQDRLNQKLVSGSDIFQKYLDIAFADINEYLEFGTEEAPVMSMHGPVKVKDPETGEETELKQTANFVRFKDSREVDGTILAEVRSEKGSAVVRLNDRMKALQWLSDHLGIATEEQRAKVAMLKAQTERMAVIQDTGEEDGVEIINDAEEKSGENLRNSDSEIPADI